MHAIEATGLSKTFGETKAVDGIDLLIDEGEVVGLLGPNGAGKTTTLMMLLGITEPDSGKVQLLGHPMPRARSRALERVNFTASYSGLPYRLRVREWLEVFADLYGQPRGRIQEVVEMFRISDLIDRFTTHLSSGQRTLVGLAKAMLNKPRLLILDEPTASLDPEVAGDVRRVLKETQEHEGFTVLITSHNMHDVERLCRRVIFIANGHIIADGTAAEIAAKYGTDDLEGTFIKVATEART